MRRLSAHALLRWTERTFGHGASIRVFEPFIADWQRHWRTEGRGGAGRVVAAVRGGLAFVCTCLTVGWQTGSAVYMPARARITVIATAIGFASLGAGALVLGFLNQLNTMRGALLAALAPSLFAVTVPLALLPAAAVLARASRDSRAVHARWYLVRLVVGTMGLMCLGLALVVPAANTQYRQLIASQLAGRDVRPPRGLRELSASELARFDDTREVIVSGTREDAREELALRVTIAVAWPVAFAFFGWRLARARKTCSTRAAVAWWAFALVTTLLISGGERQTRESLGALAVFIPALLWMTAAAALRPLAVGAEPDA